MSQTATAIKTPSDGAAHAGYRVVIMPEPRRIKAVFGGETVAESDAVLVMRETRLAPVFYFPRADVRLDLLERSDHRTNCPFKGNASYWSLAAGGKSARNAAWSYEDPFDESAVVKDYVAFDWDAIDAWFADGEAIAEQPRDRTPAKANPFVDWLVQEAWKPATSGELVRGLAEALVAAGFPLWRLRLMIQTLHPQLFANAYTWQSDKDEITEFQATHAGVQSEQYQNSPFAAIIRGEGGIRRRLDGPDPQLDFPILHDLVEEGATDYVGMPLTFSDGQINIMILVSDRPGGFSTDDLGHLYEVLATLSRLLEAHAQRMSSLTLLRTYLGSSAGERVMNGSVKRGDGEDLHAVILFSDLRGSTELAGALGREEYLATLNLYFDSVAGAVIDHGGEVLKFIGDAVLAIFPISDPAEPRPEACRRALAAVRDAQARIDAVNIERRAADRPPLAFGVALHRGNLTYGNVGTDKRLDFTVIGQAVNEASRIEGLCKELGRPVLISEACARSISDELTPLGSHALRGVPEAQEIFTIG